MKELDRYTEAKRERERIEQQEQKIWSKNFLSFNLSEKDFSYAVMGWCKYLIRPYVEPYTGLKVMDYITIKGEEGSYIARVEETTLYESLTNLLKPDNFIRYCPDSTIVNVNQAIRLLSLQVYNRKYKEYKKQHGVAPKIIVIRYGLIKDPKLIDY